MNLPALLSLAMARISTILLFNLWDALTRADIRRSASLEMIIASDGEPEKLALCIDKSIVLASEPSPLAEMLAESFTLDELEELEIVLQAEQKRTEQDLAIEWVKSLNDEEFLDFFFTRFPQLKRKFSASITE